MPNAKSAISRPYSASWAPLHLADALSTFSSKARRMFFAIESLT